MYRRIVLIAALLAVPSGIHGAGDGPLDRATLRGLKAVNVVIDVLDTELERQGVTTDELQTHIVKRLQDAGIPINKDALEFLGVRVVAAGAKKGPYALCVDVGLYQPVILSRDKEIRTATRTWEAATVLVAQAKVLNRSLASAVDQLAAHFVNAYRSVNPKPPGS